MIGFWDYTVVLTFCSLASSLLGMAAAMRNHFMAAIIFLALSGLLDGVDGRVARTKKNRTEDERMYGMQLDALCDVICFGVFPAFLCYRMGLHGIPGLLIEIAYCILAVARLAYYNVLETNRLKGENDGGRDFHGLPVTSIAIIFPIVHLVGFWVPKMYKAKMLGAMLFITGILFVIDFKVKKPTIKCLILMILCVAAVLLATIYLRCSMR